MRLAFNSLKLDQGPSPDWHPNSNDIVQDLVHPSMYPLVYGRTRTFKEECIGVEDATDLWAGKGRVIPREMEPVLSNQEQYLDDDEDNIVPPTFWSENYQWLPANVAFQEDGNVKFTSYINNLHPKRYSNIYRTIEALVKTVMPLWDQCLAMATGHAEKNGAGRLTTRMRKPTNPE